MAKPLRIALTKGRLEKDTVGLLERLGYDCTAVREKGRRLILPIFLLLLLQHGNAVLRRVHLLLRQL